jgi:hypothetical protein
MSPYGQADLGSAGIAIQPLPNPDASGPYAPTFITYPQTTMYPGDTFDVVVTDGNELPVTLSWSTLPTNPAKVTCSSLPPTTAVPNQYQASAHCLVTQTSADYNPNGDTITFTAADAKTHSSLAIRVSLKTYVALGDSYSAGQGAADQYYLPGTDPPNPKISGSTTGCHQARTSWGQLMNDQAEKSGLVQTLLFVACSGAVFDDLYAWDNDYVAENEREPPQLDSVNRDTYLATMTMGGNDVGFQDILTDCTNNPQNPLSSKNHNPVHVGDGCDQPGRKAYEDVMNHNSGLPALVNGLSVATWPTPPTLTQLYENIVERMANGTTFIVVGYPHLLSDDKKDYILADGHCSVTNPSMLGTISYADANWIDSVIDQGNTIIKNAVAQTQAQLTASGWSSQIVFDDPVSAFDNETVCSGLHTTLINYAELHDESPIDQSFHPNEQGQYVYYLSMCDLMPLPVGADPKILCSAQQPKS